jgi:hypothetical protein
MFSFQETIKRLMSGEKKKALKELLEKGLICSIRPYLKLRE